MGQHLGAMVYRTLDAQATGVLVAAGAHAVYGFTITNLAASARYVKLYDKATAPTQADTPKMTIALPATSTTNLPFLGDGVEFKLGIGIRCVNLVADNDTTAPTANDVVANLYWR